MIRRTYLTLIHRHHTAQQPHPRSSRYPPHAHHRVPVRKGLDGPSDGEDAGAGEEGEAATFVVGELGGEEGGD